MTFRRKPTIQDLPANLFGAKTNLNNVEGKTNPRDAGTAPCKVCKFMDNDWPSRNGLCLKCFCHEYVRFTGNGLTSDEALREIRATHYRFDLNVFLRRIVASRYVRILDPNLPESLVDVIKLIDKTCRGKHPEDLKTNALLYVLMPETPSLTRATAERFLSRLEVWRDEKQEQAKQYAILKNTTCVTKLKNIDEEYTIWKNLALEYKEGRF